MITKSHVAIPKPVRAAILNRLAGAIEADGPDGHLVRQTANELGDETGMLVAEVLDMAKQHGWPRPESMRKAARILTTTAPTQAAARPEATTFGEWATGAGSVPATGSPVPARAEVLDEKPEPYVAALSVGNLFADPTYQRDLDSLRVQRMAGDFRLALVGIVEVAKRADGCYAILDGQHRWATVREVAFGSINENPHIACRVHEGLTIAEEAALYHQLNTTRKQLTGWDRWLARRGAGDQLVLDIEQCVRGRGLLVGMQQGSNVLRATKACENIVDLGGIELLDQVLGVVRAAYRDDQAGLDGSILHGVAHVLNSYPPESLDTERLVDTLSGILPRQLTARASAVRELHKGTMDRLTAHVVVERYNSTKGKKLTPFFEQLKPQSKTPTQKVKAGSRERQAILEWAKRTNYAGRHDRVTPTLRKAFAQAHASVSEPASQR